ncbi:hypothetical protein FI667_g2006, partial [Globisporangium splendens]
MITPIRICQEWCVLHRTSARHDASPHAPCSRLIGPKFKQTPTSPMVDPARAYFSVDPSSSSSSFSSPVGRPATRRTALPPLPAVSAPPPYPPVRRQPRRGAAGNTKVVETTKAPAKKAATAAESAAANTAAKTMARAGARSKLTTAQQQVQDALNAGSARLTRTQLTPMQSAEVGYQQQRQQITQPQSRPPPVPFSQPVLHVPAAIAAASAVISSMGSSTNSTAPPATGTEEYNPEKAAARLCKMAGCTKRIRSKGLCKAHGGGKRCAVEGCERSSQSHGRCIRHGGGVRCMHEGCTKAAQSNGHCKAHGGGLRCQYPKCDKATQGGGFCRNHGGGQRCGQDGCEKGAQRGGFCASHGGTRYCQHPDCTKQDRGGGLCAEHGGGKRCDRAGCTKPARRKGLCHFHANIVERKQESDVTRAAEAAATAILTGRAGTGGAPSYHHLQQRIAGSMSENFQDI